MTALQQLSELEARLMLKHPMIKDRLRVFLAEYLDAIVHDQTESARHSEWTEQPLTIADFSLEALAYCAFDCCRFLVANAVDIGLMIPQAGYDFGSVRTGEYANAFSRWGMTSEAARMRLTVAAFEFGPLHLEVVDDKFVYKGKQ